MGAINSSDRMAVKIVLLRDMVCVRNMCINTLHKGDSDVDDDDDDNNNNNNVMFEVLTSLTGQNIFYTHEVWLINYETSFRYITILCY
jgi:hypothetical protein